MTITNLTPTQLRRAADLQEHIEKLQRELSQLQDGEATPAVHKTFKRKFSAAGIAKIRAAQKARWAKIKAGKSAAAKPAKRGPKKMSAEARAKIAAAQKARWAKVHAEKAGKK